MKENPRKHRRLSGRALDSEATYVYDSYGEEIVVPVGSSGCSHQDYSEDSPVCCHPMRLHVEIEANGEARIEGEHE